MKEYKHLSKEERKKIFLFRQEGITTGNLAIKLGRSRSTVWRELKRNSDDKGVYLPDTANNNYCTRRAWFGRRKIIEGEPLYTYIAVKLKAGWSPEQISGRMKVTKSFYCCHETIYSYIYRKGKGNRWYRYLSKAKYKRGKRKGRKQGSGKFLGLPLLRERPQIVDTRETFGHWEADTMSFNTDKTQNITTLVERKSRYLIAVKNENRKSTELLKRLEYKINEKKVRCRTITCDRGSEFGHFRSMQKKSSRKFYFCDPYSPWQRGTNENTNGRIRRFLPRGADIVKIDQNYLDYMCKRMNHTPRKILGFKTPAEVLARRS